MYMTQGHYGDHNDQLLEYVRQGGGLVVGGHAWWWAEQQPDQSVLLQHPGNQLITEFGLAFSKETVDIRDAAFPIKVTEVPSVKVTIKLKENKSGSCNYHAFSGIFLLFCCHESQKDQLQKIR